MLAFFVIVSLFGLFMFWPFHGQDSKKPSESSSAAPVVNAPPPIPPANPKITYRTTRWDLFIANLTIWMRNRVMQFLLVPLLGFYLWSRLSPWYRAFGEIPFSRIAIETVITLMKFIGMLGGTILVVALLIALLTRRAGLVCEHTLEITDEGLVESTEANRSLHKWPSILRVMNILGYMFIYVTEHNYHQIPRRSVDAEQMGRFERELRERVAKKGKASVEELKS